MKRKILLVVMVFVLTACGGMPPVSITAPVSSNPYNVFLDKCIVETGPHPNVIEYCQARWRVSQREK